MNKVCLLLRRALFPAAFLLMLLAAGCDENGKDTSAPPQSPSAEVPSVTATDTTEASSYEPLGLDTTLRSFASELEEALAAQDLQFFLDNVTFTPMRCDAVFGFPPGCLEERGSNGEKPPSVLIGDRVVEMITMAVLQSEGRGLDRAQYQRFVQEFLTNIAPGATDAYGGAEPALYAYGRLEQRLSQSLQGEDMIELIATRISGPRPADPQPPGLEMARQALSFGVGLDGGRWMIRHLTLAPVDYLLNPESAEAKDIFQSWQRW